MGKLLDTVNYPSDLRRLGKGSLGTLCDEIREYMVDCCSVNPGHLGSSLGAVELIVGIHYVYDTPNDNVVFDVSHQAYAHKILTGRKEAFRCNRKKHGISGFTRREESPFDVFGAGHSSTSISAALGLADAALMMGRNQHTIALIGDGSMTGGLAFEGLNNAGAQDSDILVILNDNDISIDKGTGSIHDYLLKITTNQGYNRLKNRVWNHLGDSPARSFVQRVVRTTKSYFVRTTKGGFFEDLGFRYFGPIDGNDINSVVDTLGKLKDIKGPKILHAITTKGKGYAPAEEDQTTWHAPGMFDPQTGKRVKSKSNGISRYQDVFGEVLLELAHNDTRIVGVTPAMASGCGMNLLAREMPERFFDVGIAEEHAVTFSSGLAAGGMKPFCNIYSSFSQRAYDQIIHDVALQGLPVAICLDRGGLVGEDGATHHGFFDMAAFRCVPGVVIAAPSDELELKNLMFTASKANVGPFIIRYPRGYAEGVDWRDSEFTLLEPGKARMLKDGVDLVILAAGPFAHRAFEAALLYEKESGKTVCVYDVRYIKPIDDEMLDKAFACGRVITVEDGSMTGGLFGAVSERLALSGKNVKLLPVGIPDKFVAQDTQKQLRADCKLDTEGILSTVRDIF